MELPMEPNLLQSSTNNEFYSQLREIVYSSKSQMDESNIVEGPNNLLTKWKNPDH